jgi:transcriptional regulator with XRE-family HTH domain
MQSEIRDTIDNIKFTRKELGLSQTDLSKKLGMTTRSLSRYADYDYYSQGNISLKVKKLYKIAEYLGCNMRLNNQKNTIFGEKVEDVKGILFANKWYKSSHSDVLEFIHDPIREEYFFSFWFDDDNRIANAERMSGKIEMIQAVAVD